MKRKVTYIAEDGKEFGTTEECIAYEGSVMESARKKHLEAVQKSMQNLDDMIWRHYYPEDTDDSKPEPHVACIWLMADITHILSDDTIDAGKAELDIVARIREDECGEEILSEYVDMKQAKKEAAVRRDYQSAFATVKHGGDLGGILRYSFAKRDIYRLAKLHKSNKCRRKIEELLTACNFHYECGKFASGDYAEFLAGH